MKNHCEMKEATPTKSLIFNLLYFIQKCFEENLMNVLNKYF